MDISVEQINERIKVGSKVKTMNTMTNSDRGIANIKGIVTRNVGTDECGIIIWEITYPMGTIEVSGASLNVVEE